MGGENDYVECLPILLNAPGCIYSAQRFDFNRLAALSLLSGHQLRQQLAGGHR